MKKILIFAMLAVISFTAAMAQNNAVEMKKVVFMFEPQDDMFYMRENSHNQSEWARLSQFVDANKAVIRGGDVMVFVTSYSVAMPSAPANRLLAKTMANRVKTELILKNGLKEEDFTTRNKAETFEGKSPVVVVEITIPAVGKTETVVTETVTATPVVEERQVVTSQSVPEPEPTPQPVAVKIKTGGEYSRWSLGINVGLPFLHGDMVSWEAHNNCYIGFMGGIQAGFQMCPALGLSLSADYGQNKAGSRIRDKRYNLSTDGVVLERFQEFPTGVTALEFNDLYQKSSFINVGLHLDLNLNRLFTSRPNKVNFILSPGVYGQNFTTNIYTKDTDTKFVTEELNEWNLGVGGDLAVRFRISNTVDLQLKGTGIWIDNDKYDNIRNDLKDYTHWMWSGSAGVIFKLGGNQRTNLFYK